MRIEQGAEPIPGYRLLTKIGSGGFGEVWKCEAPGGLLKAVKIVHGAVDARDPESLQRAEQELQALKHIQEIRHPYLLSLDRYDIIAGRLVIVTELADCNLWERFQEFRNKSQIGIPRDDVLRYMLEAAEVLDLMNTQHQLQHLDIKPQNLFLVHDHIKVADFGLVKGLDGRRATISGGVTPIYAAPETFDGLITPYCDQYSLAIVYTEMLTGQRPYAGGNVQQIIMQHLHSAPDLSPLPPGDRGAVLRGLAKKPEDRHPSCMAMIRTLLAGGASAPPPMARLATAAPPVEPNSAPIFGDTPPTNVSYRREDLLPTADPTRSARPTPPEVVGDGALLPAVVIGVGQSGLDVLRRFRRDLLDRFGTLDRLPNIRLLFVDTDPQTTQQAIEPPNGTPLSIDEVVAAKLNRPGHYLKPRRNGMNLIDGWFDAQMLYRIKAANPLTQGLRALGRLAFCDHFKIIAGKIREDLEAVTHPEALDHANRHTDLGLRSNRPRVYIVAGLGGGTGGGMFLDLAYTARNRLRQFGYEDPEVIGLLMLPPIGPGARSLALGNSYAALTELNHFGQPGMSYMAAFDDKDGAVVEQAPPFARYALLQQQTPQTADQRPDAEYLAAEYLSLELVTPVGRAADAIRGDGGPAAATFGLFRIGWPRRALLERAARLMGHRLLARWLEDPSDTLKTAVRTWLSEQWSAQQLGPEAVAGRLHQACERAMNQSPEALFAAAVEGLIPRSRWSRSIDPAIALQAANRVQGLVGKPDEGIVQRTSGRLEEALATAAEALRKDLVEKVGQLTICLIEQPDYRLGAADEALLQTAALIDRVAKRYAPLSADLTHKAKAAYQRLAALLQGARKVPGTEAADAVKAYGLARFQSLVARHVLNLFGTVRESLAERLRNLTLLRNRLTYLRDSLLPGEPPPTPPGSLLPDGCETLDDAVRTLAGPIDEKDLRGMDRQVQQAVEQQFVSLTDVCQTSPERLPNVEAAILQVAEAHVAGKLGSIDVVSLFLSRHPNRADAKTTINWAFAEADPSLELPDATPRMGQVLALPNGPSTVEFHRLALDALPNVPLTVVASPDDIVFYREYPGLALHRVAHLGPLGRRAYEQMTQQQIPPHTRGDIHTWYNPEWA